MSNNESDLHCETIARAAAAAMTGAPTVAGCRRMRSGFANANYKLETTSGVFLLRHRIDQDRQEVEYELDVLDWLLTHEFPAPKVIRFEGGHRWLRCPDDTHLVLLEWLDGSEPEANPSSVRTIARALGDFHCLPSPTGDWWHRENPIGCRVAANLVKSGVPDAPELMEFFAEEVASLHDQLGEPLPRGLIHGDLFPDNSLFQKGRFVAMLDFESACEDSLLFDVAMAIHGFCFRDEKWTPQLADIFVASYYQRRPLTDPELAALPTYMQWCPLAMMGWHLQQLRGRPDQRNLKRATELAQRVTTINKSGWMA